jgi:hypothetical protein
MEVYFKNGIPLPAAYAPVLEDSLFMQAVSRNTDLNDQTFSGLVYETTQRVLTSALAPFIDKFLKINKVEVQGTSTALDIEVVSMPSKEFDIFYMAYCLAKISNLNPMVNSSRSGWDMVLDLTVQLKRNQGVVLYFAIPSFVLMERLFILSADRDVGGLCSAYVDSVDRLSAVADSIREITPALGQEYVSLFERVFKDTGGYVDARGKCAPQINQVEFAHLVESYWLPTRHDQSELRKLHTLYASYITGKAGRSPAFHADVHSLNLFTPHTYRFN